MILLGKKSGGPEEIFFKCDYYNYHANNQSRKIIWHFVWCVSIYLKQIVISLQQSYI